MVWFACDVGNIFECSQQELFIAAAFKCNEESKTSFHQIENFEQFFRLTCILDCDVKNRRQNSSKITIELYVEPLCDHKFSLKYFDYPPTKTVK